MKIHVGVLGNDLGWKLLLEQEGLPHSYLHNIDTLAECSAIVVSDSFDLREIDAVQKYLSGGGAMICSGKIFSHIAGVSSARRFVKYLVAEAGSEFAGCGLVDLFTNCDVPAYANQMQTDDGHAAVFVGEYSGGLVAVLPFDADGMIRDYRVMAKSFYARRSRLPHEQVSLVSKGSMRKLIVRALELLHHKRGIPYVHTWYYPRDAQSVFALRIDTDYGNEEEIDRLYQLAEQVSMPFSWFVHVRHQQKFLEKFKRMNGHEIGVHCYDHIRYHDEEVTMSDLRKAIHLLEAVGIHPNSFCAPYGMWKENVAQVIDSLGFEYSSEFSYDDDSLPSYPVIAKRLNTLQVPVHPISIGSLRRQGFTEEEMLTYYTDVVNRKLDAQEPIILYHHPNNRHENVLKGIIEHVKQLHISALRMIDYAAWWKRRDNFEIEVDVQGTTIRTHTESDTDDVWLHITKADGTECLTPVQSSIDMQKMDWKPKPIPAQLPKDYLRTRKFNPWIYINHLEDSLHQMLFPKP